MLRAGFNRAVILSFAIALSASGLAGCGAPPDALGTPQIPFPVDRAASFSNYVRLGSDTYQQSSAGATVQGTSLLLDGGAGTAFAVYQFTPLSAADHVDVTLDSVGTLQAYVGIADYATQRWRFTGPFSSSQTVTTTAAHVSPLGSIYVAVAVGAGGTAKIDQLTLAAANVGPTATFAADTIDGDAPLTVNFNAGNSTDPDGFLTNFAWDLDGDGTFETDGGGNPALAHTFTEPGIYNVSVQVTDDGGAQAAAAPQTITAHGWVVVLVDGSGSAYYPNLISLNGFPAIGHWDGSSYEYSHSSSALGASAADWVTLVAVGSGGSYSSFAQIAGNPAVCWYDSSSKELRYLRSDTADGLQPSDWGTPAVVKAGGVNVNGYYTCLAEINGSPAVAYIDMNAGSLEYARANTATGTQSSDWVQQAQVDAATAGGYRPHLTALADGHPAIAYRDQSLLGYAYSASPDGAQGADWTLVNPVGGSNAVYMTLAVVNGTPAIGYLEASDNSLRYARSITATGDLPIAWLQQVGILDVGAEWPPWLAVSGGRPAFGYYDGADNHMKFVGANTADGGTQQDWAVQSVIDPNGTAGRENCFAEINGLPAVCYSQGPSGADNSLYYAILL